jgi:hypothetical protein
VKPVENKTLSSPKKHAGVTNNSRWKALKARLTQVIKFGN